MPTRKPAAFSDEQNKILHAKQEWEQTFDAVSDLVFIVDNDLNFIRANRAMADHCGLTPMELVGRKCYEVMHGTKSAPDNCLYAKIMECREPQKAEYSAEKLKATFDVTMSPIFNAEGHITSVVHVARDITDKKRYEELLLAQKKQLEEINSTLESHVSDAVAEIRKKDDILIQQSRLNAMGEMISNIAHQWRQPLNNIGLIVQSLQLAFKANDLTVEELNADVAETMKVLQQISDTIDDFRNFFSYEEHASSFVVNEMSSRALSFVEQSLKRKEIRIEVDEEPDVTADGFPNECMQVLLNVILNARDALVEHHEANKADHRLISIRVFRENGRAVVTVRDNAGGIAEDVLPKIFDPYFTTKKENTGAGIGLYMSKMIIEKKMHGNLTARNVDGGAEFRIEM